MTLKKIFGYFLSILGGFHIIAFAIYLPSLPDRYAMKRILLVNSDDETKLALATYGIPIAITVISIVVLIAGIKLIRSANNGE
jgi:hypothetical protein